MQELRRVLFYCVAIYIGIKGNEVADRLTKGATDKEVVLLEITEGEVKQKW